MKNKQHQSKIDFNHLDILKYEIPEERERNDNDTIISSVSHSMTDTLNDTEANKNKKQFSRSKNSFNTKNLDENSINNYSTELLFLKKNNKLLNNNSIMSKFIEEKMKRHNRMKTSSIFHHNKGKKNISNADYIHLFF